MATNFYFQQGSKSEQDLYESIVIESIKMYGQDVYYLPRDLVNVDSIFRDDPTSSFNSKHLLEMMNKAMDHEGFSVIECLSECVEFYKGAFDATNPRKGGAFELVPEEHDTSSELAAYQLAEAPFPGYFGVYYESSEPTKNENEAALIKAAREKTAGAEDWEILQKTFDRLK